jgi:rod shape-determining protein MreC
VKRKGWTFWLGLGAIIVIVLNLPVSTSAALKRSVRDVLSPLQSVVASFSNRVAAARDVLAARGGMPDELSRLREDTVLLKHQLVEFEDLQQENLRLRHELGFMRRTERLPVAAEVLARDISGWWQMIRVDHGGGLAVQPDQAVISSEGLVGKVVDTSRRTADILLITDPACRVAVRIGERGVFGILSGQGLSLRGRPVCRLELMNKDVRLRPGDAVYTSGLGGVFPRGLLVGHLDEITLDENGLHQSATVIPAANVSDLRVVFILTAIEGEGP